MSPVSQTRHIRDVRAMSLVLNSGLVAALHAVRLPNRHITPDARRDHDRGANARPGGTVEFTPNRVPDAVWIDHHEAKSQRIC
jgi:hypothetical protein